MEFIFTEADESDEGMSVDGDVSDLGSIAGVSSSSAAESSDDVSDDDPTGDEEEEKVCVNEPDADCAQVQTIMPATIGVQGPPVEYPRNDSAGYHKHFLHQFELSFLAEQGLRTSSAPADGSCMLWAYKEAYALTDHPMQLRSYACNSLQKYWETGRYFPWLTPPSEGGPPLSTVVRTYMHPSTWATYAHVVALDDYFDHTTIVYADIPVQSTVDYAERQFICPTLQIGPVHGTASGVCGALMCGNGHFSPLLGAEITAELLNQPVVRVPRAIEPVFRIRKCSKQSTLPDTLKGDVAEAGVQTTPKKKKLSLKLPKSPPRFQVSTQTASLTQLPCSGPVTSTPTSQSERTPLRGPDVALIAPPAEHDDTTLAETSMTMADWSTLQADPEKPLPVTITQPTCGMLATYPGMRELPKEPLTSDTRVGKHPEVVYAIRSYCQARKRDVLVMYGSTIVEKLGENFPGDREIVESILWVLAREDQHDMALESLLAHLERKHKVPIHVVHRLAGIKDLDTQLCELESKFCVSRQQAGYRNVGEYSAYHKALASDIKRLNSQKKEPVGIVLREEIAEQHITALCLAETDEKWSCTYHTYTRAQRTFGGPQYNRTCKVMAPWNPNVVPPTIWAVWAQQLRRYYARTGGTGWDMLSASCNFNEDHSSMDVPAVCIGTFPRGDLSSEDLQNLLDREHLKRELGVGDQDGLIANAQVNLSTRNKVLATALLNRAIVEGDNVFEEFPGIPVIPFACMSIPHAGQYLSQGHNCLFLPRYARTLVLDGRTQTGRVRRWDNKGSDLDKLLQVDLPPALNKATAKFRWHHQHAIFITITYPPSMDLIETWCRCVRDRHILIRAFEKYCASGIHVKEGRRQFHPIMATLSIEGHHRTDKDKKKTPSTANAETGQQEEGNAEGEEDPDQHPEEESTGPACKEVWENGGLLITRGNLTGAGHIHAEFVYAIPDGYTPLKGEVETMLGKRFNRKYVQIKHINGGMVTLNRHVAPPSKNISKAYEKKKQPLALKAQTVKSTIATVCGYTLKGAKCTRTARMLKMVAVGSPDYRPAALVIYEPELRRFAQQLSRVAGGNVNIEECCSGEQPITAINLASRASEKQGERMDLHDELVERTMAKRGENGNRFNSPTKVLVNLRQEGLPAAFNTSMRSLTHEISRTVEIISEDSQTDEEIEVSPADAKGACRKLYEWLLERVHTVTAQVVHGRTERFVRKANAIEGPVLAARLVTHLAMLHHPRVLKAKQVYVWAEPDAGKSTLASLIRKAFPKRTFTPGVEASGTFGAAEFIGKAEGAIWIDDEYTGRPMSKRLFNLITEGQKNFQVARKLQKQARVTHSGFTVLMSNQHPTEHFAEGSTEHLEFNARFVVYVLRKPARQITVPSYSIVNPVALRIDMMYLLREVRTHARENIPGDHPMDVCVFNIATLNCVPFLDAVSAR